MSADNPELPSPERPVPAGRAPLLLQCLTAWLLLFQGPAMRAEDFQGATHLMPFDEDTIKYSRSTPTGPVAKLQERLERGEVKLKFDSRRGYLPALLDELKVPSASQMLVFSKTSLQRERISPKTPRALFFNDDVYLGFIPGAPLIEVSMADAKLGGVFYTLEQKETEKPRLVRTDQCLECHASAKSMGVPGHLVRSFNVDESGIVDLTTGTSLVSHRTPFEERWGGWYVTGTHGDQKHRGNLFGKEAFEQQAKTPNYRGNLTDLKPFIDTSAYPQPGSDVVALMVLEHQSHMHNFVTRLGYEGTITLAQYGHVKYLKTVTEAFLRYLLFVEETPLTATVRGTSEFAKMFAAEGPKDRQGRSLREFDLETRLFKHPCSYLIYSEAFDSLPEPVRELVYRRLHDILTGKDTSPAFQKIPAETRQAILEILIETKPGLPDYWKEAKS